ncbi:MAG: DNA mismatch repair protein MutS, partial [Chloroflexota bacterium]
MAGIPHHALPGYLKRFMEHGLKVAICEQMSEPGKGLVDREVVRVVTPGTLVESDLLEPSENNYLAAVHAWRGTLGLAYIDVTTGEFAVTEFGGPDGLSALESEITRLAPSECLAPDTGLEDRPSIKCTDVDAYLFDPEAGRHRLCKQLGVRSLEGFGCDELPAAIGAAGAVLTYIERTNKTALSLLRGLRTYRAEAFMVLDRYTRSNLELTESTRSGGKRGTLVSILDSTRTAMGGRLLRRWIGQPLLDIPSLELRHDAVEELYELAVTRTQLRAELAGIADLERLTGRVCQSIASPENLLTLSASLRAAGALTALLSDSRSQELVRVRNACDPCADVSELIERAVRDPQSGSTGKQRRTGGPAAEGYIRAGYSGELDGMRSSIRDSRQWIANLEPAEQERTGIRSLKVGYNKVFGFYLEISNANREPVPEEYLRKQTLVNAERFVTPELKEHEARILQAEERISALERRIFSEVLETLAGQSTLLFATAHAVGQLDVYQSMAEVARRRRYVRPAMHDDGRLEIVEGRHPVVEATLQ